VKDFLRDRFFCFEVLVLFILSKSNKGLNICLEEFSGGAFLAPTKSAFPRHGKNSAIPSLKSLTG
jgi:hypothetical protein